MPPPVLAPQSDEATLVQHAQADRRAFGALYDRYVDAIYRYCYRHLADHHEAEDATAHTFRRALEALPGYQWTGAPFGAWLFKIAANHVADRQRARARLLPLDPEAHPMASDDPEPPEQVEAGEELAEVWQAVNNLPPAQQRVLTLRFGQGLTNQQVARILNRSETATKQLVYRALQALRARYQTQEEG